MKHLRNRLEKLASKYEHHRLNYGMSLPKVACKLSHLLLLGKAPRAWDGNALGNWELTLACMGNRIQWNTNN